MPVFVSRRTPDDVASVDLDDLFTFALGPTMSGSDDERLAERVRMPI